MTNSEIEDDTDLVGDKVPALAVTLKMSGKVTVPPTAERTMRLCAKLGEFPIFQVGNSSRQYVMIEDLRQWMKRKTK